MSSSQINDKELPRAPTPPGWPSYSQWAATSASGNYAPETTPPPPPPPADKGPSRGAMAQHSSISSNPFFASSYNHNIYQNTSLAGSLIAGQQINGALVEASEFRASSVMKEDGVQHNMYAGWRNNGESGLNSNEKKWFEKRNDGTG